MTVTPEQLTDRTIWEAGTKVRQRLSRGGRIDHFGNVHTVRLCLAWLGPQRFLKHPRSRAPHQPYLHHLVEDWAGCRIPEGDIRVALELMGYVGSTHHHNVATALVCPDRRRRQGLTIPFPEPQFFPDPASYAHFESPWQMEGRLPHHRQRRRGSGTRGPGEIFCDELITPVQGYRPGRPYTKHHKILMPRYQRPTPWLLDPAGYPLLHPSRTNSCDSHKLAPNSPGDYAFIKGRDVAYVGKTSVSLRKRLSQHGYFKHGYRAYFWPQKRPVLEQILIHFLAPSDNEIYKADNPIYCRWDGTFYEDRFGSI
ncbi:GIY-YIG nuclease family protein [Ferrimonas marina]|uniref:GIY-YIG domain-containing protein n=1 Tax=Ferrimonas marina TaxID=299255 RepID=A0A1M5TVV2_9GAMM|nr:hypothetical protein [Ferrimonas marina]SHH54828.1 hypothetical protein SAMN02745129_2296 [Ferrimonas marina]